MAATGAVHCFGPTALFQLSDSHTGGASVETVALSFGPIGSLQIRGKAQRGNKLNTDQRTKVKTQIGSTGAGGTFRGETVLGLLFLEHSDWSVAGFGQREGFPRLQIKCLASKRATTKTRPESKSEPKAEAKKVNGVAGGKGVKSAGSVRPPGSRGFGTKIVVKKPETKQEGAARLKISERVYSKLGKDELVRTYVISVRRKGAVEADWLPVSAMNLLSKEDGYAAVSTAMPFVCREVAECARRYAVAFENCLSHELEYAFESEKVFGEKPRVVAYLDKRAAADAKKGESPAEETPCPYSVLGLTKGATPAQVRSSYRSMAAAHHPDRHAEELREEAEVKFKQVAVAYEQIKQDMNSEDLVGGTGTLAEDGLTPVEVKAFKDGPMPEGMKAGVVELEAGLTDLFITDKNFRREVGRSQQSWVPPGCYY